MKKFFLLLIILVSYSAQAKDYMVVVRSTHGQSNGHTEVFFDGDEIADTLSIIPAKETTTIYVLLKDIEGRIVEQYIISPFINTPLTISSPQLPNGYFLEIRDNKETVFKTYDSSL